MLDLEAFEKSIKLVTPWTHPLPSCTVSILQGSFVSKINVVEVQYYSNMQLIVHRHSKSKAIITHLLESPDLLLFLYS